MQSANERAEVNQTQRTYARLAGGFVSRGDSPGPRWWLRPLSYRGQWNLRRNGSKDRSIGTVISPGALEWGDRDFEQRSTCLCTLRNPEASQQSLGPTCDDLQFRDSFVALVVRMCGFVRLHLYITAQSTGAGFINAETLTDLLRSIASTDGEHRRSCFRRRLVSFLDFALPSMLAVALDPFAADSLADEV